jgi:hypothetical protein
VEETSADAIERDCRDRSPRPGLTFTLLMEA